MHPYQGIHNRLKTMMYIVIARIDTISLRLREIGASSRRHQALALCRIRCSVTSSKRTHIHQLRQYIRGSTTESASRREQTYITGSRRREISTRRVPRERCAHTRLYRPISAEDADATHTHKRTRIIIHARTL